ncbi:hypothetical protein BDZ45DRAFT_766734, partial [Acephala macrosclerotiorum]
MALSSHLIVDYGRLVLACSCDSLENIALLSRLLTSAIVVHFHSHQLQVDFCIRLTPRTMNTSAAMEDSSPTNSQRRDVLQEEVAEPYFSEPDTLVTFLVNDGNGNTKRFQVHKENLYAEDLKLHQLRSNDEPTVEQCKEEDFSLVELWLLADYLYIPRLQNCVVNYMNEIAAELDRPPSSAIYKFVYDNTPSDSPLRKAIVILSVAAWKGNPIRNNIADYPAEMTTDILTRFADMRDPITYENVLRHFEKEAYVPEEN